MFDELVHVQSENLGLHEFAAKHVRGLLSGGLRRHPNRKSGSQARTAALRDQDRNGLHRPSRLMAERPGSCEAGSTVVRAAVSQLLLLYVESGWRPDF
jgi:hypothetical protein